MGAKFWSVAAILEARSKFDWEFAINASFLKAEHEGKIDVRELGRMVGLTAAESDEHLGVMRRFGNDKAVAAMENVRFDHLVAALDWDDATDCLSWANDNNATTAEMKAWRRLQRGEDVTSV